MRIKQLTSYPNPNELGLGNTNETYIRIENALDVSDMFPINTEVSIVDSRTGKAYIIKAKVERTEFRINKLGQLYRDYNVRPGDEIKFTYIEKQGISSIFFTVTNFKRSFLSVGVKGTEIVNIDNLDSFAVDLLKREYDIPISQGNLVLKYDKSDKKRADSPIETEFYTSLVNDVAISKGNYYVTCLEGNNILEEVKKNTIEEYSLPDDMPSVVSCFDPNSPLQQIFYGAPGTGKSDGIKKRENQFAKVIRTTFHPDSDYSTFVGCYKPTMLKAERIYNNGELINLLSKIKLTGTSYPCQKWASKYWESLKGMNTDSVKSILSACGFTDSMTTEVSKSIAVGEEFASNGTTNQITYAFTPQAFTQAYLEAWRKFEKNEPVLLVIEEINRGNCAQIFGDLFQLLDRNDDGYSTYPIVPDTDLCHFIGDQGLDVHNAILKNNDGTTEDISEVINSGEKLVLPPNLYIWATMNTSDQSLFPIDSAFKRRWDWTYVPIKYENKAWRIEIGGPKYEWVEFQRVINKKIYEATESEDKQLGDWFVKAENNIVTANVLLNKIIFYLWNDVCKSGDGDIFRINTDLDYTKDPDPQKNVDITFSQFFDDAKDTKLQQWMHYLGIKPTSNKEEEDDDPGENVPERVSDTNMPYRVTFPDGEVICNGNGWDTYVAALRKIGLDKALPYGEIFHRKNKTLPLITTKRIPDDGIYRYYDVDGYYVLSGTDSQHRLLKRMNKDLNLGLTIE